MNSNITTITHVLQKEYPDRAVQHQFSNSLHTFRLGSDSVTHWLYVARELVEQQSDVKGVHHLLNLYSAADALHASPESRWLFLDNIGVHEVDEGFASYSC